MPDHTPEPASDLEPLLRQWADDALRADPRVAPHLDELTDHLRSAVEARIEAGQDLETAFEDATLAFGEPAAVAAEYLKGHGFLRRWLSDMRTRPNPDRAEWIVAASWIGFSLIWAGATLVADLSVNWMLVGWFSTTFGPLTVVDTILRRRRRRIA
jgi:hypothetical protein